MNFNTCVGSGSADLRVWMQPLRGWVSFSIPELSGMYCFVCVSWYLWMGIVFDTRVSVVVCPLRLWISSYVYGYEF